MIETIGVLTQYLATRYGPAPRTRKELERHQERQLRKFRKDVLTRSAFYADMVDRPLRDFPIMDKVTMMANFDAINTVGLQLENAMAVALRSEETRDFSPKVGSISVGLSTGTSGKRGIFIVSDEERRKWAGIMLGHMLPGSILDEHRVAFLLRANNNLYESVSGKGRIAFQFFDLMRPLDENVSALEAYNPTIIIGPAQVLRLLAEANGKSSNPVRPKKVISVAEVLFDDDRIAIENGMGVPVGQIYQCTEGFLAYTCPHGSLHLNERFVRIEFDWLSQEEGRFRPIITDFSRSSQPIVRYRLDDVLTIDPVPFRCPCGSPEHVIWRIEGREDDMLLLAPIYGNESQMVVPDYITRALVGIHGLKDFEVVQTSERELEVYVSLDQSEDIAGDVRKVLDDLWKRLLISPPNITVLSLAPASLTQKRRRVRRQFR